MLWRVVVTADDPKELQGVVTHYRLRAVGPVRPQSGGARRILLLDGDDGDRDAVATMLEKYGPTVRCAFEPAPDGAYATDRWGEAVEVAGGRVLGLRRAAGSG